MKYLILVLLVASSLQALTPLSELEKGDEAYRIRLQAGKAIEALGHYRQAIQQSPSAEAFWRLSMAYHFVGLRVSETESEQSENYRQGMEAGLQSLCLSSDCAPCHFWTAINQALYGQSVGIVKMFFTLGEVEEHLKASLSLQPDYAEGGAYRVLGAIKEKLPGILGGSNSEAKHLYEAAIKVSPSALNFLFLARLLRDSFDDKEAAKTVARQGLRQNVPESDHVESIEAREDLAAFVTVTK